MSQGPFPRRPAEGRVLILGLIRRVGETVRSTPGLLLISIALGVAIWVFVTEEQNPARSGVFPAQIPVEAVNVGSSLAVANVLPSVDIRIEAPEDRWDELTTANFRAFVDLNGFTGREQTVPIRVEVRDARRVRVLSVEPPRVVVNLESIVSRIVPVEPRLIGAFPRGFEAADVTPGQGTVQVSGPESLVELVAEAVGDVNVTGLTVDLQQSVTLVARAEGGGEIRGVQLSPASVGVTVQVRQTVVTRDVPLTVELAGAPAPGYRVTGVVIQPSVIRLEGSLDALQDLDSLSLGEVRLDGASEDIRLTLSAQLDESLSTTGRPEADVVVTIAPVDGSTALTLVPELINVAEGLTADAGDQTVTVTLDGPLPDLNALVPGDVRVVLDVSSVPAGTFDVAPRVEAPASITVREVHPETVQVTLAVAPSTGG